MPDEREHAPGRAAGGAGGETAGGGSRGDATGASSSRRALVDGRYDAVIVLSDRRGDGVALSCVLTTGPQRGDVVDIVSARFAARDPLELIGLPCTLVVLGDEIRIEP